VRYMLLPGCSQLIDHCNKDQVAARLNFCLRCEDEQFIVGKKMECLCGGSHLAR